MESQSALRALVLCLSLFVVTVQCNPTTAAYAQNQDVIKHSHGDKAPEGYDSVAYCDAYCDMYGYYQPGKWCVSQDSSVEVYCCGNEFSRYCCADPTKDVGDMYPAVKSCPNSSWWYYQWRVIVGLLGTLVVMLLLAACCYYCCGGTRTRYGSSRRSFFSIRRRANTDEEALPSSDTAFDPESPHAFRPPAYDLPKDPPKYIDAINGAENAAFDSHDSDAVSSSMQSSISSANESVAGQSSTETVVETPPPVYEEVDSSSTEVTMTDNPELAAVHAHGCSVAEVNDGDFSQERSSVTGIGNTQQSTNNCNSVEHNPPPPYEAVPNETQNSERCLETPNNTNSR